MLRLTFIFLCVVVGSLLAFAHKDDYKMAAAKPVAAVSISQEKPTRVVITARDAQAAMPFEEASEPEEVPLSIRQQKALAFMIDGEAGDEPFDGKRGVAFVATGRAHDNKSYWGGKDLVNVVCKHDKDKKGYVRWQFDGAKLPCQHNFAGKPSDFAMDIAGKILSGEYLPTDEESRWRYFFNQYESGLNGAMSLLCDTKISRTIGGHIFAEPKPASKTCLWQRKHHHQHTKKTIEASTSVAKPKIRLARR